MLSHVDVRLNCPMYVLYNCTVPGTRKLILCTCIHLYVIQDRILKNCPPSIVPGTESCSPAQCTCTAVGLTI
jgi:hypothetical protein